MGMNSDKCHAFQEALKENLEHYLSEVVFKGQKVKISKGQALAIFKIALGTPVQFLAQIWEKLGLRSIPTSYLEVQKIHKLLTFTIERVAKFAVHFSRPRQSQGRPAALRGKVPYIPHYKIYPSRSVKEVLLREFSGMSAQELHGNQQPKKKRMGMKKEEY